MSAHLLYRSFIVVPFRIYYLCSLYIVLNLNPSSQIKWRWLTFATWLCSWSWNTAVSGQWTERRTGRRCSGYGCMENSWSHQAGADKLWMLCVNKLPLLWQFFTPCFNLAILATGSESPLCRLPDHLTVCLHSCRLALFWTEFNLACLIWQNVVLIGLCFSLTPWRGGKVESVSSEQGRGYQCRCACTVEWAQTGFFFFGFAFI